MSQDIHVLALVKGEERYLFLFDDNNRTEILRQIGRYASNPELNFTWYDAAVMSQKVRRLAAENDAANNGQILSIRQPLSHDPLSGEEAA